MVRANAGDNAIPTQRGLGKAQADNEVAFEVGGGQMHVRERVRVKEGKRGGWGASDKSPERAKAWACEYTPYA